MTSVIVSVSEIRDNLSEILGRVKFGEEIVTVEKKGKPYAVIMSPEEYQRYKQTAKKVLLDTIRDIQATNTHVPQEEVLRDVTKVVEEVRQDMYERGK